jgi:dTDP-4-dehydrorhamnose 3,5-epimerase
MTVAAGGTGAIVVWRPMLTPSSPVSRSSLELPAGVGVRLLTTHHDDRGAFTELFRDAWETGVAPVQWNAVRSEPHVLRGVHCHVEHADALVVAGGRMRLGLCDLRPGSDTAGRACVLDLDAEAMMLVTIPPGVAHGFYFPVAALHVYAVDRTWDPDDELGCRWDDPDLGIPWGDVEAPLLSARDECLGTRGELERQLSARAPA